MDRAFQIIVGFLLLFVAVVLAAIGASGVLLAAVGAVVCVVLLIGLAAWAWRNQRYLSAAREASVGSVPVPLPSAAVEHARLLRRTEEPAEKRDERHALRNEARQVSRTYRAMEGLSDIEDTSTESRITWLGRVLALQRRRDDYAKRWSLTLPDPASFSPVAPPIRPDWLEAMARDADVITWQLDNEEGAAGVQHTVAAVGGTRITCTCGRRFDTGPAFDAHIRGG